MKDNHFFPVIVLLIFSLFGSLFAQEKTVITKEEKMEQLRLQRESRRSEELGRRLLEEAYESAIDPETYIVGPGDYFSIVIWGDVEISFQLPVTPEGILIVPNIGTIKVDSLTLRQTKSVVKEAAMRNYKETTISTILISMRKIRVRIIGEVLDPGTYIATPVDRVSDLIFQAGGLMQYAYLQNINIKHRNDEVEFFNFSDFKEKGDLENNPLVKGGDIINIPHVDYSSSVVRVEGFIENPGYYPFIPGENVINFLKRHDLLDLSQMLTDVKIYRYDGVIIIADLTDPESNKILLKYGDKIVLPLNISSVYVIGSVLKPGPYNFVENLRLRDYVGLAGVNENAGSLGSIRIRHVATGQVEKGGDAEVFPGDVIEVPIRRSKRYSEYLQIASQVVTLVIAYFAIRQRN